MKKIAYNILQKTQKSRIPKMAARTGVALLLCSLLLPDSKGAETSHPATPQNRTTPRTGYHLLNNSQVTENIVIPELINYQGRLVTLDATKTYVDGLYNIEFRIWNKANGGDLLWGERYSVYVKNGHFNVVLGLGGTPIQGAQCNSLRDALHILPRDPNPQRYLGITVLEDENRQPLDNPKEAFPRQQILTTGYAIQAQYAQYAEAALNPFQMQNGLIVSQGQAKFYDGIRVNGSSSFQDGLVISGGGLVVSQGGLVIQNGDVFFQSGIQVSGKKAVFQNGVDITGGASISGGATVEGQLQVKGSASVLL